MENLIFCAVQIVISRVYMISKNCISYVATW